MLCSAYIKVYILPIFVGFLAHQSLVVVWVHIAKVVCRATRKARHCVQFQWENSFVVYQFLVYNLLVLLVPSPSLGASQWRLARFGRFKLVD